MPGILGGQRVCRRMRMGGGTEMGSVGSLPQLIKFWEIVASLSSPWASSKSYFSIAYSAVCTTNGTLVLKYAFKHCSFSIYFMQFFPLCKTSICLPEILWYIAGGICCEMMLGIGALSEAYVFGTCSISYSEFWVPGFLWCLNHALYVSYYLVFYGLWGWCGVWQECFFWKPQPVIF